MSFQTLAEMKTEIANSGMSSEMQTVCDAWLTEIWGSSNNGLTAFAGGFTYSGAAYTVLVELESAGSGSGFTTLAEFEAQVAASSAPSTMKSVADAWVAALFGTSNTGITFSYLDPSGDIEYFGAVYLVSLTLTPV